MGIRLTLLTPALRLAHQATAKAISLIQAHDIANTNTPVSESQAQLLAGLRLTCPPHSRWRTKRAKLSLDYARRRNAAGVSAPLIIAAIARLSVTPGIEISRT